ncbi:MAG: ATPase, partial [Clostridiales bacterium]|nr:ATPase [Clostridiales bacterium]
RGVRPFYSDKFDITKHKRYKELAEYSDRNSFDLEKYLKHELVIRQDDEFELIEVDTDEA